MMQERSKLSILAEMEGYADIATMLLYNVGDSIVPAICTNEGCDYCEALEPDQTEGFCPECETNSMKSCLVLAHLI